MASVCCYSRPSKALAQMLNVRFKCCSINLRSDNDVKTEAQTPKLLKVAVNGVTEILRFFSRITSQSLDTVNLRKELLISNMDDVMATIKSDYENAYFVTGLFTSEIYAESCMFEDPTIKFRGRELYARNLKLLVPFFVNPSIKLEKIEKDITSERQSIVASWKLRTFLKLPWMPLISIDGTTVYELDKHFQIIRHAESWSISALEAIGQIFTPSFGRSD